MRIKVGHNKLFGGIILGLGLANVVLAAMAGRGPSLFLGPLFVLIGILYLIMPAFVVADGCFQVKNLIGVTLRRYHFGSPREIEIEGSKIYLRRRDGTRELVKGASRGLTDGGDWTRLQKWVAKKR